MPEISVIVPVYKVEPYLYRCVDSILAQTFRDFELILVDDGSPDGCPAICDAYAQQDSRVHVIHQENSGVSAARNTGIDWAFENSDSQWISFVDSDDSISVYYLESMMNAAKSIGTELCICANSVTYNTHPETRKTDICVEKVSAVRLYSPEESGINLISAWGKLYRKEQWRYIRYPVGKIMEDRFTTHKLIFQNQHVAIIRQPLYFYYLNESSIMRSAWTPKRLDDIEAAKQQFEYFEEHHLDCAIQRNVESVLWMIQKMLEDLNQIAPKYGYYKIFLRWYAKKILWKYRNIINYSVLKDAWAFEIAYPFWMAQYWHWQVLRKKIKIK